MKIATTPDLIELAKSAEGRNRCIDLNVLRDLLDREGTHVLFFQMPHGSIEMRTAWYAKFKDIEAPATLWLDIPFDSSGFQLFNELPTAAEDANGVFKATHNEN